MTELNYFTRDLGISQGRIPINGEFGLVLGTSISRLEAPASVGDVLRYTQSVFVTDEYLTVPCTVKAPIYTNIVSTAWSYALNDGDTLTVRFGQEAEQTITFNSADFVSIANASSYEVAHVINQTLSGGYASVDFTGLVMRSHSNVSVYTIGGTAASEIGFVLPFWELSLVIDGFTRSVDTFSSTKSREVVLGANTVMLIGLTVDVSLVLELKVPI